MTTYEFQIVRYLGPQDVAQFVGERLEALSFLNQRYLQEIKLDSELPTKPEYLDALRTSWVFDSHPDRPPHILVVRALGMALGKALEKTFGMKWAVIKDHFGEVVSLVAADAMEEQISVPPFSFVEKRHDEQDPELFVNLFALLEDDWGCIVD